MNRCQLDYLLQLVIASLPNFTNAALMTKFYKHMKNNGASEIPTHIQRII